MTDKKQGRRSAEAAEQTKLQILKVASEMFCRIGYARVSLRSISEQAGVSHSLIRHHFGSKEKIWHCISDLIHEHMLDYMRHLFTTLPADIPANEKLYHVSIKLMAFILESQKPMQLIADAARQHEELLDYFIDGKGEMEAAMQQLTDEFKAQYPESDLNIGQQKWEMIMYAHSAISMRPFLLELFKGEASTYEECLLKQWYLYEETACRHYYVTAARRLRPAKLTDLVEEQFLHCIGD